MGRTLKAYSDYRSEEYAALMRLAGGRPYHEMLETVTAGLELLGGPKRLIVELGVGTGNLARRILGRYPKAAFAGLDGSAPMLEKARHALARFGGRARLDLRDFGKPSWMKALSAPDAVVSTAAVHHLTGPGKRKLFLQIYRLLAPGGVLLIGDPVWPEDSKLRELNDRHWAGLIRSRYARRGGKKSLEELVDWIEATRQSEGDRPSPLEHQLRWLREAGFRQVDCHWKHFGFAVFGGVKP